MFDDAAVDDAGDVDHGDFDGHLAVPVAEAQAVYRALAASGVYRELVYDSGWTPQQFRHWLTNALQRHLFGTPLRRKGNQHWRPNAANSPAAHAHCLDPLTRVGIRSSSSGYHWRVSSASTRSRGAPVLRLLPVPGSLPVPRCVPSIGTVGDSYDALAETVNGYYNAELIRGPARNGRPWKTVDDVELHRRWVHWHDQDRLQGYLGVVPPAEFEQALYATNRTDQTLVKPKKRVSIRPSAVHGDPRSGHRPAFRAETIASARVAT